MSGWGGYKVDYIIFVYYKNEYFLVYENGLLDVW